MATIIQDPKRGKDNFILEGKTNTWIQVAPNVSVCIQFRRFGDVEVSVHKYDKVTEVRQVKATIAVELASD